MFVEHVTRRNWPDVPAGLWFVFRECTVLLFARPAALIEWLFYVTCWALLFSFARR